MFFEMIFVAFSVLLDRLTVKILTGNIRGEKGGMTCNNNRS